MLIETVITNLTKSALGVSVCMRKFFTVSEIRTENMYNGNHMYICV